MKIEDLIIKDNEKVTFYVSEEDYSSTMYKFNIDIVKQKNGKIFLSKHENILINKFQYTFTDCYNLYRKIWDLLNDEHDCLHSQFYTHVVLVLKDFQIKSCQAKEFINFVLTNTNMKEIRMYFMASLADKLSLSTYFNTPEEEYTEIQELPVFDNCYNCDTNKYLKLLNNLDPLFNKRRGVLN